nr:hypothetical protein [candidate division KSB1 bacterium]NIT71566.1 hypothetical protein [candidate division KSB1 bacterium]NIW68883.1 hypothetical protein [candidate division KSB1 bacterium]NIX71246.1 hypothetical protein [candidate division KSB1 bacterium]
TKLVVSKITPRGMKAIRPYVDIKEGRVFLKDIQDLYSNPEEIKSVCEACFEGEFKNVDWEEFDIEQLREGLQDFLQRAFGS